VDDGGGGKGTAVTMDDLELVLTPIEEKGSNDRLLLLPISSVCKFSKSAVCMAEADAELPSTGERK